MLSAPRTHSYTRIASCRYWKKWRAYVYFYTFLETYPFLYQNCQKGTPKSRHIPVHHDNGSTPPHEPAWWDKLWLLWQQSPIYYCGNAFIPNHIIPSYLCKYLSFLLVTTYGWYIHHSHHLITVFYFENCFCQPLDIIS